MYKAPANNIGYNAYFGAVGVVPTTQDFLACIMESSGDGLTVNSTDATLITSGVAVNAPTTVKFEPITFKLFVENSNYRFLNTLLTTPSGSDDFLFSLVQTYPKNKTNAKYPNLYYPVGHISSIKRDQGGANGIQTVSLVYEPMDWAQVHAGFGSITDMTADKTALTNKGGYVTVTVIGTGMVNGIAIVATDAAGHEVVGTTKGTATSQIATLYFPPNASGASESYNIRYALDCVTLTTPTTASTVTVAM